MPSHPLAYISYSRADRNIVLPIVQELRGHGVEVWIDAEHLKAGESWEKQINEILAKATAIIVFVSKNSLEMHGYTANEIAYAVNVGAPIVLVLIDKVQPIQLPKEWRNLAWIDTNYFPDQGSNTDYFPNQAFTQRAAQQIAEAISKNTNETVAEFFQVVRGNPAKALVAQAKDLRPGPEGEAPNSVFVVHGHDEEMLTEVVAFVEALGVKAIVLKNVGGASRSLMDRFFEIAGAAKFAIALLSADDWGASRQQFDEPQVGERALRFRARQNVILELGYFYGLLGWDSVFVIEKSPPKVFPDFERPSDLNGVVFDRYDGQGKWKSLLIGRLQGHGFVVKQSTD